VGGRVGAANACEERPDYGEDSAMTKFLQLGQKRWIKLEHVASVVDTSDGGAPACKVRFVGSDEEHLSGEEAAALLEHLRPTPPAEWKGPASPFKDR
jgi:hypothetical protein